MTTALHEERAAAYDSALGLCRTALTPYIASMEQRDEFPREFWNELATQGLLGAGIDERWGGSGGDYLTTARICEAMSRVSPAMALSYGAHLNLCAHSIDRNGTDEQRERWLPQLCDGSRIGAMALTEPGAGSDALGIATRAERVEGGWSLTGSKTFITNAPIACTSVVYARTDPEAGNRGLTAFIVDCRLDDDSDAPGLTRGPKFDKVGMRGSPTGELFLDGVFVPDANVLGGVGNGLRVIMSGLDLERAFLSFLAVGVVEECLELSLAWTRDREQFGRPIAQFQLVQAKLADMYAGLFTIRAACTEAMELAQTGVRCSAQCAAALLVAAETACRVAEDAVQLHGGVGYMHESPVQRYWRDAKLATIGAGTSEIRRLLIARELLGDR